MDADVVALLLAAALLAGWTDAVVGGGGLIQLPVVLLALPHAPVAAALGTNKLASVFGTGSAAIAYARKVKLEPKILWPTVGLALAGSGLGAALAGAVSSEVLRPVVMAVLLTVVLVVGLRPQLGSEPDFALRTRARVVATVLTAGVAIAFYDGIVGPGTGVFLVLAFTAILGLDFVTASAQAKIVNAATNVGALAVFAWNGHVMWLLGLSMGVFAVLGAQLGARMAIRRGARFVRVVIVVVVLALLARMGYDLWVDLR
ncbi:MAG: TSUP family transporter [Stackebrandtia sp.]